MKLNKLKIAATVIAGILGAQTAHAEATNMCEARGADFTLLNSTIQNFKAKIDSSSGRNILKLYGAIPEICYQGMEVHETLAKIKRNDKIVQTNSIMIVMPNCATDQAREEAMKQNQNRRSLSDINNGNGILLVNDVTGKLALSRVESGDCRDPDLKVAEDFPESIAANLITKSSSDIAQANADEREKARKASLKAAEAACKSGNIDVMKDQLAKAGIEDISNWLDAANESQISKAQSDALALLAKADSAESAQDILARFRAEAAELSLDEHALDQAYLAARLRIAKAEIENLDAIIAKIIEGDAEGENAQFSRRKSAEAQIRDEVLRVQALIDALKDEMVDGSNPMDLDAELRAKAKYGGIGKTSDLVTLYAALANIEVQNKNIDHAVALAQVAKQLAPSDQRNDREMEIVDMLYKASESCRESSNYVDCMDKYRTKAERIAGDVGTRIIKRAQRTRDPEDISNAQSFMRNYNNSFGAGPRMYYPNYGISTPQYVGGFEMMKRSLLQQYMQGPQPQMYNGMPAGMNNGMQPQGPGFQPLPMNGNPYMQNQGGFNPGYNPGMPYNPGFNPGMPQQGYQGMPQPNNYPNGPYNNGYNGGYNGGYNNQPMPYNGNNWSPLR